MSKLLKRRGFTPIELMIVVAIIGILAAIAIPNFIRFQARSKQGEAKANLKALFTAERSFYQEKDRYSSFVREIGFAPERGNRYFYQVGSGTYETRNVPGAGSSSDIVGYTVDTFKYTSADPTPTFNGGVIAFIPASGGVSPPALPGGTNGNCPVCEFSGVATGNIDNETTGQDTWYIGSTDSTNKPAGKSSSDNVPAGQPQNSYNDVDNDS